MHIVPNNLPENMQTLSRVRQACRALSMPQLPVSVVICVDYDFDFHGRCYRDLVDKFPFRTATRTIKHRATVARLARRSANQMVYAVSDNNDNDRDRTAVRVTVDSTIPTVVDRSAPQSGAGTEEVASIADKEEEKSETLPSAEPASHEDPATIPILETEEVQAPQVADKARRTEKPLSSNKHRQNFVGARQQRREFLPVWDLIATKDCPFSSLHRCPVLRDEIEFSLEWFCKARAKAVAASFMPRASGDDPAAVTRPL
nr:hypothetical protein CFP56_53293 [Quercus suber]